jgi:hypothetical protein
MSKNNELIGFEAELFHDSVLVSVDFERGVKDLNITLHCPYGGHGRNDWRYLRIRFNTILYFAFESASWSEIERRPLINDIVLLDSSEAQSWASLINGKSEAQENSECESENHSHVYHFLFDSVFFSRTTFYNALAGFILRADHMQSQM